MAVEFALGRGGSGFSPPALSRPARDVGAGANGGAVREETADAAMHSLATEGYREVEGADVSGGADMERCASGVQSCSWPSSSPSHLPPLPQHSQPNLSGPCAPSSLQSKRQLPAQCAWHAQARSLERLAWSLLREGQRQRGELTRAQLARLPLPHQPLLPTCCFLHLCQH